jgi:hypothetical protein
MATALTEIVGDAVASLENAGRKLSAAMVVLAHGKHWPDVATLGELVVRARYLYADARDVLRRLQRAAAPAAKPPGAGPGAKEGGKRKPA